MEGKQGLQTDLKKEKKIIPLSHVHLEKREKETNILQKFESTAERTWILLVEIKSLSKRFLLKTIQGPKNLRV